MSKNKDDLTFVFYDFKRIIKKVVLEENNCLDRNISLSHNDFEMKADVLCENNNAVMDIFISYKDVSFSDREIITYGIIRR